MDSQFIEIRGDNENCSLTQMKKKAIQLSLLRTRKYFSDDIAHQLSVIAACMWSMQRTMRRAIIESISQWQAQHWWQQSCKTHKCALTTHQTSDRNTMNTGLVPGSIAVCCSCIATSKMIVSMHFGDFHFGMDPASHPTNNLRHHFLGRTFWKLNHVCIVFARAPTLSKIAQFYYYYDNKVTYYNILNVYSIRLVFECSARTVQSNHGHRIYIFDFV